MSKIYTYVIIMSGLMLMFHIFGLIETGTTPTSTFMALLLEPESLRDHQLSSLLVSAMAIVTAGAAVFIGFITKDYRLAGMTLFASYLFILLWDFIAVFNLLNSVNKIIALLIISPFMFGFVVAMIQFWEGKD